MKRFLLVLGALLATAVPAFAQLTPAPFALQQYLDDNGEPYGVGGICVYRAGTSTLASSYTTAAGSVANANPLMLSSGGRPSSNGFFLTPGSSYKLVLVDFTSALGTPTCSTINGVTVWTQDNIEAVPGSASAVDLVVTAGESIAAGNVVYISTGAGATVAGNAYLTDSDAVATSVAPFIVGVAPSAIASGAMGSIRIQGQVTTSGLTQGQNHYASATAGGLTSTAPTNARLIGQSLTATTFVVDPSQTTYVKLITTSTAADSLDVGGGINAGTGNVGIVDTTGKIPALNSTYLTSVSGQSLTGIGVLQTGAGCSTNSSTTTTAAETLATCAITGLTQNDTIRVVYTAQAVTQQTAGIFLFNGTDTVQLTDLSDNAGVGAMLAGTNVIGEAILRRSQDSNTSVYSYTDAHSTANAELDTGQVAAVVTGYTGTWNLTYTKGATTAGGTLRWAWSVYVQRGQ